MVVRSTSCVIASVAVLAYCSSAFTSPNVVGRKKISTSLTATTLEPPVKKVSGDSEAVAWDCDDEINCVVVPACDEEVCRTSLDVRIHGVWYDLSGWRKAHPAGEHWIDWYDGRDATEVMDAFHSDKGRKMYKRLPKTDEKFIPTLEKSAAEDSSTQIAFRKFRQELEDSGWFKRDMVFEATQLGIWGSLVITAAATAHSIPFVSFVLLSLSMTAAGWLGHDYVHGVDKFCDKLRNFSALAAGLAPVWWSDKHNKHHALTNEQGADEDIATNPFLFTWAPDPSQDSPLRKIQHWIFWIPFSFLFALWRVDSFSSVMDAIETKRPGAKGEMNALLIHYFVLFTLFPTNVWLPSIFLSGLMSALIVTPTHQSEEMFEEFQPDWVSAQFLSTRNAVMTNPFSEWLWGGMQYQLEHHLFPSMPRVRYPKLKKKLMAFAKKNNVAGGYRESGEFEILRMNWNLYKKVAEADAVEGAPLTTGRPGQVAAIDPGI